MKSKIFFVGLLFAVLFLASLSYADVPQMINYYGQLTTPEGELIDTMVSMTFAIYTDSVGGDPLWSETQDSVKVEDGVFSVLLGSVNRIPNAVFTSGLRYLGIKVGSDPEMVPRNQIASVGYAFRSEYADTAEYALSGAGGGGKQGCGWVDDGDVVRLETDADRVGIGTANPSSKLQICSPDHGVIGLSLDGNTIKSVNSCPGFSTPDLSVDLNLKSEGLSGKIILEPGVDGKVFVGGKVEVITGWGNYKATLGDGSGVYTHWHNDIDVLPHQYASAWLSYPGVGVYGTYFGEAMIGKDVSSEGKLAWGGSGVYGTGTSWGGYFDGKGYFSDKVGIGTTEIGLAKLKISAGGLPYGVYASEGNYGIYGIGSSAGVYGFGHYGVLGVTNKGSNDWGEAVVGASPKNAGDKLDNSYDVINDPSGRVTAVGVLGRQMGSSAAGVWAKSYVDGAYAGWFDGNVGIGRGDTDAKLTIKGKKVGNKTVVLRGYDEPGNNVIVEIGEGLDYSETFPISQDEVTPGMVMVIDPVNKGFLTISVQAYDKKVAGIVAGANSLGSGVRLGSQTTDAGNHAVALAGRVYCNVDTQYGDIEPGDLLTTSPTPGHAMVVKDFTKAQGAILGKAMEGLSGGGKGQILVLVSLQ